MTPRLITNNPVARHSPDHQNAAHSGSGNDNSTNPPFLAKLLSLFPDRVARVLDLGCAGGGFVKSVLDAGHFAVGLEGSDYSKLRDRAEWATVPGNLFTCDVTKPFLLYDQSSAERLRFDVVTAWEVMEHFSEGELPQLVANVKSVLAPAGIWVMSVSLQHDGYFHRCVRPREWWLEHFAGYGFEHDEALRLRFEPDWVRGPTPTPWAITAPDSFHLVLRRVCGG